MAKLAVTSRTVITIGLIVLNLDTMLRFLRALLRALIRQGHRQRAQSNAKCNAKCNALQEGGPSLTWICNLWMQLLPAA